MSINVKARSERFTIRVLTARDTQTSRVELIAKRCVIAGRGQVRENATRDSWIDAGDAGDTSERSTKQIDSACHVQCVAIREDTLARLRQENDAVLRCVGRRPQAEAFVHAEEECFTSD